MIEQSRILALDPGYTIGYALVDYEPPTAPVIIQAAQIGLGMNIKRTSFEWRTVSMVVASFSDLEPDVIVIEDYRLYFNKALSQVGSRLLTSELIGAICQEAAISEIPVIRLMAGVKRNWPIARMNSRYPAYKVVPKPHALDALLLALYYIEKTLGWIP